MYCFAHETTTLTLKEAGGGDQSVPSVRRLAPISHRIMLWSQKFLTLSINIPPRRQSSCFFTILTGFPEIRPRLMTIYDFLGSKIMKSIFFQFFHNNFYFFISNLNYNCSQLSFEVYFIFVASKLKILAFQVRFFYALTSATLATSRGPNFSLSNLNRV